MADPKRITELTSYTPAIDTDVMPIVDITNGVTKKITFANIKATLKTYFDTVYGTGSGTVTTVSVTTANGVSGTVATATTTPAITLSLGAITPTTVNGLTITANGTNTLNIAAGKTLVVSNNITLTATDGSTLAIGTGGTLGTAAYTAATDYATAAQGTTADNAVPKSLYDANSILYATSDNTPLSLTVGASTIVGRKSTGDIVALTATETRTILNVADGATANTKATGAELDTGTDDVKFATAKALKDSHNVPSVAPGTSGNVLTSNGTDWTSATPASSTPIAVIYQTSFEYSTRFTVNNYNSGAGTFATTGLRISCSGGTGRGSNVSYQIGLTTATGRVFSGNPKISGSFAWYNAASDSCRGYIGLGTCISGGTTADYTTNHIGFKLIGGSSIMTLYATQGNNTNEDASSALVTLNENDYVEYYISVVSGTSATFYYKVNNGSWSAGTTLNTYPPAAATNENFATFAAINNADNTALNLVSETFYYSR